LASFFSSVSTISSARVIQSLPVESEPVCLVVLPSGPKEKEKRQIRRETRVENAGREEEEIGTNP
jgi:hypothetical protein